MKAAHAQWITRVQDTLLLWALIVWNVGAFENLLFVFIKKIFNFLNEISRMVKGNIMLRGGTSTLWICYLSIIFLVSFH